MKHKLVVGFISLVLASILIAGFASGLINLNHERIENPRNRNVDSENSIVGTSLVKPPKECLNIPEGSLSDPDFGNPLTTTDIGLFCYYNETTGWNLTQIVPAFQNYTDHGNYIDGYIRVYQDGTGNTYSGSLAYIDCYARVRVDGWIMSWITSTQNKSMTPYYASSLYWPTPLGNATVLARAIQRVYFSCSKGTLPWVNIQYIAMRYYSFEYPTARKMIFVGRADGWQGTVYWYFTIPSTGTTSIVANVFIYSLQTGASASTQQWYIDTTLIVSVDSYSTNQYFKAVALANPSLDAKHTMKATSTSAYNVLSTWMLILWLA